MPTEEDTASPPPELTVLESLKETCEAVRKHNANPDIAQAALDWETKIAARIAKLTGGAGREVATAA